MRFQGKTVLVTGGSRGIGRAISEAFGREGAQVIINYSPEADAGVYRNAAEEAVKAIVAAGGEALAYPANVAEPSEVGAMIEDATARYGPVEILVNNAGICPFSDFLDLTPELWNQVFAVNLRGTFLCSQAVARIMIERKIQGRIICISSIGAVAGTAFQSHYCATKAGINLFVKSIATALGPSGITVNAVMPGAILTDINRQFFKENPEVERDYLRKIPVGRLGVPHDIAGPVLFLASEEAGYINGATLLVDGGFAAHL
jgi:L-rhamnose 1-dehydrogenase